MSEFNFDKFEKHIPEFTARLKAQMRTRLFDPIAPDFDVEVSIYEQHGGYGKRIKVATSDIAKHMNFAIFASVGLHDFGGNVVKDKSSYWLPIDWTWSHKDGGSNGTTAFTVYLDDAGEIIKVRGA